MLITGYNAKRDRVIRSLGKLLVKLEDKGIITEWGITDSCGMGSYETLYIGFLLPGHEDPHTIRYSGHPASSNADFYLWNRDFKTITELKKAILTCITEAKGEIKC